MVKKFGINFGKLYMEYIPHVTINLNFKIKKNHHLF